MLAKGSGSLLCLCTAFVSRGQCNLVPLDPRIKGAKDRGTKFKPRVSPLLFLPVWVFWSLGRKQKKTRLSREAVPRAWLPLSRWCQECYTKWSWKFDCSVAGFEQYIWPHLSGQWVVNMIRYFIILLELHSSTKCSTGHSFNWFWRHYTPYFSLDFKR